MTVAVSLLTEDLEKAYSLLIKSDERSMIYPTLEFQQFLCRVVSGNPKYYTAVQNGEIVGILPCFEVTHRRHGRIINSLPWYGSYGGCVLKLGASQHIRQALLDRYLLYIQADDVSFATLVMSPYENGFLDQYMRILKPAAIDSRIGQITELPDNGVDLESRLEFTLTQKTRNLVRKSRNQGFVLCRDPTDTDWDFMYSTHVENMQAIGGQPKPWDHFQAMQDIFPKEWRILLTAKLDEKNVASLLLLRYNSTVEYVTPVIKQEFRSLQPLSFLIWNGMLDAVQDGYKWWNWGGTWRSQKSLYHFKSGWGAKDLPYTYIIHAKPEALSLLRSNPEAMRSAFPYYFIYPYHLLGCRHA